MSEKGLFAVGCSLLAILGCSKPPPPASAPAPAAASLRPQVAELRLAFETAAKMDLPEARRNRGTQTVEERFSRF